jgi:hypothetical protein
MESLLPNSRMHWAHEPAKGTLTPSPSPIGWERVAGRPGEGSRFMKSPLSILRKLCHHEPVYRQGCLKLGVKARVSAERAAA